MHEQSVVVFGGTGFIGTHLAARLAEHAVSTVVPTRHEAHAKHLMPLGVDIRQVDLGDDAALRRLVAGHTAVINLVGILHSRRGDPYGPDFRRVHVELPRRIVAACAAEGVPRYLHMSALGADRRGPSMYQRSRADGEAAAVSEPTVAATIFRPSVVFGPEDRFLNTFARLQRHLPVVPLACAHARFQPVWVDDVAEAIVRALDARPGSVPTIECVGPEVHTLQQLVRFAGQWSGHARPVIALPSALGRLQALLLEAMPGEPLMSRDNIDSMKLPSVASGEAPTLELLGITPRSLDSVMPDLLGHRDGPYRLLPWRAIASRR